MVTSPTGKGVLIVGGRYLLGGRYRRENFAPNEEKIELTGDSIENLKWNVVGDEYDDVVETYISFLKKFQ